MEHLESIERDGIAVLTVCGELDLSAAPQLQERLLELADDGHRRIVVDLEGVEFIDSAGLGVLVRGFKRARLHDGDLALVCTRERILKLLEITSLTRVFGVHPSVDEAVADQCRLSAGDPPPPRPG